jgi:hypothetical protein
MKRDNETGCTTYLEMSLAVVVHGFIQNYSPINCDIVDDQMVRYIAFVTYWRPGDK